MYSRIRVRPCLTVRAPIPFLKKRINILLDAYISNPKIRRKWAENRGQTPVKKLALDFKIFFSAFFKKKREMHSNVV